MESDTQSLEDKVRSVLQSSGDDWPDWMHMKGIEISRVLDEADSLEHLKLFLVMSHLGLLRRVQALEVEAIETDNWAVQVDGFNEYVDAWLAFLEDNMDPDNE